MTIQVAQVWSRPAEGGGGDDDWHCIQTLKGNESECGLLLSSPIHAGIPSSLSATVWNISLIDAGSQPLMLSVAGDGAIKAWLQQPNQDASIQVPSTYHILSLLPLSLSQLPQGPLGLANWYTAQTFTGYSKSEAVRVEADLPTWECVGGLAIRSHGSDGVWSRYRQSGQRVASIRCGYCLRPLGWYHHRCNSWRVSYP